MEKRTFKISRKFLETVFKDVLNHIGWSDFYKRFVLVEPIWYIKLNKDILIDCVCIDDLVYDFKKPFGKAIAEIIDEEASEFIEQTFISGKNYIFLCDNPIFFPYNRIEKFVDYLETNKSKVQKVDGLIHYHINEKELNKDDLISLNRFFNKITKKRKTEYLGIVISQKDPTKNFELIGDDLGFIINLFDELRKGNISFSGKIFYTDNGLEDCNLSIQ